MEHDAWEESDSFARGDERLCHLAVVDAIDDFGVEAGVAAASVDHAEAGAGGAEVSQTDSAQGSIRAGHSQALAQRVVLRRD